MSRLMFGSRRSVLTFPAPSYVLMTKTWLASSHRNQRGLMFGPALRRFVAIVATRPCSRKYFLTSSVTIASSSGGRDSPGILAHSTRRSGRGGEPLDEGAVRAAIGRVDDGATLEITRRLARIRAPLGEEGALATAVAELLDRPGIDVHVQSVVPG